MSNKLYCLGPCTCPECGEIYEMFLDIEHPFFGVGPLSILDLIKKSRISCPGCLKTFKPNQETIKLFKVLKKAKLSKIDQMNNFKSKMQNEIFLTGYLDKPDDLIKEKIIDKISANYYSYEIPRSWFDNFFCIIVNTLLQKQHVKDLLYK